MKLTKNALRLNPELVHEAELEARIHKRTTPKQIEYWAEIGKQVTELVSPDDLVAISQGFVHLQLTTIPSNRVDPDVVFQQVEDSRQEDNLSSMVTSAKVYYEASQSHPGLLDRIRSDGSRETGYFRQGKFRVATR